MGNVPKKLQLLKPLPGGGGGGNVSTFDVVISTDANGAYTTDKTLTQIVDAHNAGNVVRCQYNHDDITITTSVAQVVSSNGQHCAICQAFDADGNQAYFFIEETGITLVPYSGGSGGPGEPGQNGKSAYEYAKEAGYTGTEEEFAEKLVQTVPDKLPNPKELTFNSNGVITKYDGSAAKTVKIPSIPVALPNPEPLYINNEFYNGSEQVTIETFKNFYVSDNGDGTFTVIDRNDTVVADICNLIESVEYIGEIILVDVNGRIFSMSKFDQNTNAYVFACNDGTAQYCYAIHEDNTITYEVIEGGSNVDEDAVNTIIALDKNSVKAYGAKGDGVTDDTAAFQTALAENRTVTVPGGTYIMSDTLVIRENCGLKLSQDTVLKFIKTSGNCIEMRGSAVLRGNHGNINAPYGFTGNVVALDTTLDGLDHKSIPPYPMQCPQWKRQRFVYDTNILMLNPQGYHRMEHSETAQCTGNAIYMKTYNDPSTSYDVTFMWGIVMAGVRIAGGFKYGIFAENISKGWNHDMRIEAVIEGCETGVNLISCNSAHLDVTIQPNTTVNPSGTAGIKYAKCGIRLENSTFVDATGSFVWDWKSDTTLLNESEENQHIALYGDCRGLVLSDPRWHNAASAFTDVRTEIYTDTLSNYEKMTILQEPITRWFKTKDGKPFFFNGTEDTALMLKTEKFSAEQAEFIQSADGYYTYDPNYTNLVNGYHDGYYLSGNGALTAIAGQFTTTDYIPIDGTKMHTYRIGGEGIQFDGNEYDRVEWYDANKTSLGNVMPSKRFGDNEYYPAWVEDESVAGAFVTLPTQTNMMNGNARYFRITARGKGENLIITIDEKQENRAIWHGEPKRLDESIYAQSTFLKAPDGTGYRLIVNNDGTLGTEPMD